MASYRLEPHPAYANRLQALVFTWDEQRGTVSGPGAAYIEERAAGDGVSCHPVPSCHDFSSANPLRSKQDMAAILGYEYQLPEDLAEHYPKVRYVPGSGDGWDIVY